MGTYTAETKQNHMDNLMHHIYLGACSFGLRFHKIGQNYYFYVKIDSVLR